MIKIKIGTSKKQAIYCDSYWSYHKYTFPQSVGPVLMIRVRIRGSVQVSNRFKVRYRLFISVRIRGSVRIEEKKEKKLDL
jgi:hypothetical protein